MSLPFGFPDEYSARRTFEAVGAVERNLASPNKTYNADQDYRIRITGAGTHAGTLTGWNVVAGELVNPSPTTTHDVAFSSVLVAYPSGAQAPAVNSVVMARIGWVDDNGVMVWTYYPPVSHYPYGYGDGNLNSVVIPLARYRCEGSNLQERIEYWRLTAPQISATVFDYDPNADGNPESRWWCVGGECVQSTSAPEGYNAGPYSSQAQCAENCI